MTDLFSIFACPTCRGDLQREGEHLICPSCDRPYPIVNGVPVLLPDASVPSTVYQHELKLRPIYDPWVHRVVMQSLPSSAVILDIGSGNLDLDLPNVIRMDVTLTPYVDVVGDAHQLPFKDEVFDLIFSLAVVEHLRQPFHASEEMYRTLRNGGYVYGDCNFVFAYHGYPHHYFNASQQGIEQIFSNFEKFRSGVAPYQLPSVALNMVLTTYLKEMDATEDDAAAAFRLLLQEVLDQPLATFDAAFTEEAALKIAAGVFYFGRKALPTRSAVVPPIVQQIWQDDDSLQDQFPALFDLGHVPNVMLWARDEGRHSFQAIDDYFKSIVPFQKRGSDLYAGSEVFDNLPVVSPDYLTIPAAGSHDPAATGNDGLKQRLAKVAARSEQQQQTLVEQNKYIQRLLETLAQKDQYIRSLEAVLSEGPVRRVARRLKAFKRK